jgi:hypothetical protein
MGRAIPAPYGSRNSLKDDHPFVHLAARMGNTAHIAGQDFDQLPDQTNAADHEKETGKYSNAISILTRGLPLVKTICDRAMTGREQTEDNRHPRKARSPGWA